MIKQIIFDFGGVLLDLDKSKTNKALYNLFGVETSNEDAFISIFRAYEVGAFSEGSFLHRLQRLSSNVITEKNLVDAYNAMLGPMPKHRFEMLESLAKDYEIYLLSNTNHTHMSFVFQYLKKEYGINDFNERFFKKAYYSHLINLRKPNSDIFDFICDDAQIEKQTSLFIDDSLVNVEGAKKAGLNAVQHNPSTDISISIKEYLKRL